MQGRKKELVEKIEQRIEENQAKAEQYDDDAEHAAWFRGIATGYEGALELLEDHE
jgi:hypothetical protein